MIISSHDSGCSHQREEDWEKNQQSAHMAGNDSKTRVKGTITQRLSTLTDCGAVRINSSSNVSSILPIQSRSYKSILL